MFARSYTLFMHFENDYCEVLPSMHYDVLIDKSEYSVKILRRNKSNAVPCLYTTFESFFKRDHSGDNWEKFRKLELAEEHNDSEQPTKRRSNSHSEART